MKRVLSSCSAALAAACLSSCTAVHPLPDDVNDDVNTVAIVKKIRCEAAESLFKATLARLKTLDPSFAKDLVKDNKLIVEKSSRRRVNMGAYNYFDKYNKGEIGYQFNIDIEGTANRSVGITLIDVFNLTGERQFDIGGGIEQKNQAKRQFQISDRFITLLRLYVNRERDCTELVEGVSLYPITGRVGLDETVDTFFGLNDLAVLSPDPEVKGTEVTRYTDELVFTTMVEGRLNPKIVLAPSVSGATASQVGMVNSQKRIDKHSLIISIAVPVAEIKGDAGVPSQALKNIDIQQTIDGFRTLTNRTDAPLE